MSDITPHERPRASSVQRTRKHSSPQRYKLLFLTYGLTGAAVTLAGFALHATAPIWAGIQTAAVIVAGAIYLHYTHETVRLRETAEDQIDISHEPAESTLRPMVVAVPHENVGVIALQNIGNGPALNVRVLPVESVRVTNGEVSLRFRTSVAAV